MPILCERTTKKYYFPTSEKCAHCQKQFKPSQVGVVRKIEKLGIAIFCEKCMSKTKKPRGLESVQMIATATDRLIPDSFLVNESGRIETQPTKSSFDVPTEGKTIDHTKYAKSGGAMRMESPLRKTLEEIDYENTKPLDKKKVLELLKESRPVSKSFDLIEFIIPKTNKEIKQIDGGNHGD